MLTIRAMLFFAVAAESHVDRKFSLSKLFCWPRAFMRMSHFAAELYLLYRPGVMLLFAMISCDMMCYFIALYANVAFAAESCLYCTG